MEHSFKDIQSAEQAEGDNFCEEEFNKLSQAESRNIEIHPWADLLT